MYDKRKNNRSDYFFKYRTHTQSREGDGTSLKWYETSDMLTRDLVKRLKFRGMCGCLINSLEYIAHASE